MTQINAIRWLSLWIIITLLTLWQSKMNCKKVNRSRQIALPFVAVAFDLVGIAVSLACFERLQQLLAELDQWIASLNTDIQLSNLFSTGIVPIANLILLLAFILLKCIACPVVSKIWRRFDLVPRTSAYFYQYDEWDSQWFLNKRWLNLRRITKAFVVCGVVVTGCLLGYLWTSTTPQTQPAWFPSAALIILTEVWCFLNGLTKEEFHHQVDADEVDARRVGNFYRIREIYEKIFAPQVLAAHMGCEFSSREGATTLLQQMADSEDALDRQVAQHFASYGDNVAFDVDCIHATRTLMEGKSVVFFNPFYRDLEHYLILPIISALLHGKKCLVVAGRTSIGRDATQWIHEVLDSYSNLRFLWRARELSTKTPECDVGVLTSQQLYDVDTLQANREFLAETDFVLLLEPSVMVNTGQIGLSILAEEMGRYGTSPVYCICDHHMDGLVDTISHVLHTEITNVAATPAPRCTYTGMGWNADGDFLRQRLFGKEVQYLGNGTELAAVAVKNQVPQVIWCGETKSPLKDLQWIVGQHYATICRYMNLPVQQKALYDKVKFVPALWSSRTSQEQFLIVEDEFCNLFGMMRTFLSRGDNQAFINVLSENYLLRDYMRCNPQMFRSDPYAIPSLVADYAKTQRNTLLKLIVQMAFRPVPDDKITTELQLAGCNVEDTLDCLSQLLEEYTFTDGGILDVRSVNEGLDTLSSHVVNYYSISQSAFQQYFAASLKTAYYVEETEKQGVAFINAKMYGHVPQTVLPGQFVVYDGKYYEVKSLSPDNGVVLRRAADLYDGRRYYRQLRTYHLEPIPLEEPNYSRKMLGLEIACYTCDFSVTTQGYIEVTDSHDLRKAREIHFEDDPATRNYDRKYHNKEIMTIRLPDTDTDLRFTFCMLLSELFRSVFPEGWPYLAVLSQQPDDIEGIMQHMVYTLDGDVPEHTICIVEDSDLDLGLLSAINRNLPKFLEILCDYLEWHAEKMREPEHKDPVLNDEVTMPQDVKRRNMFLRMAQRIRKLFGGGEEEKKPIQLPTANQVEKEAAQVVAAQPKSQPDAGVPSAVVTETDYSLESEEKQTQEVQTVEDVADGPDYELDGGTQETSKEVEKPEAVAVTKPAVQSHPEDTLEPERDADLVHIDGTDIFEGEGVSGDDQWLEDRFTEMGINPIRKSRYQRECFLKFGFEEIDHRLKLDDLVKYLRVRGCGNNALTKARKRELFSDDATDLSAVNHCDFCGVPLSGVSYERLNDGRVRCNDCSASAISTTQDFETLFHRILTMMEGFFGASYHVPIHAKMADARAVARGSGAIFRPSAGVASRVLGFAKRRGKKYSLIVENGSPRLAAIDTMVHEMTHIWQYLNWKDADIRKRYGKHRNRLIVYEGMACWAAVQFLYSMGEIYYAERAEDVLSQREDEYGIGFLLYRERYPFVKDMSLIKYTPFNIYPPI